MQAVQNHTSLYRHPESKAIVSIDQSEKDRIRKENIKRAKEQNEIQEMKERLENNFTIIQMLIRDIQEIKAKIV
ncbi:MAG: hypothetical protein ACOC3V_03430 [bacterium]